MRFGEILIEAGIIDPAQLDAALSHQQQTGQLLGEALLELGYISESNLLRFLAQKFNTQYVSTKKLSRASIAGWLLDRVPQQLAEEHMMFPILASREKNTLGLVTCEPQNQAGIEEARIISGMEKVQVYVGLRNAIRALIKKHYRGEIHAFDFLDKENKEETDKLMVDSGHDLTGDSIEMEAKAKPLSSGPAIDLSEDSDPSFTAERSSSWTQAIEAVRGGTLFSDNDFIETLNILVGLIEVHVPSRQGHSATVAKTVKEISERLGQKELEINHNIIAAYLHDLGKRGSTHLTLLSIESNAEYRRRAQRYHLTPSHLFDSVHLPPQVNHVLTHLYENFDGSGLPERLEGEHIPAGARIIAAVDAFEDLVHNSENYFEETLPPVEALQRIQKRAGQLFDPDVTRLLAEVVQGEAARAASEAENLILVADPDTSATSVLELKLLQDGFQVRVARDSHEAEQVIAEVPLTAAVVEMGLEPDDGFIIMEKVQSLGRTVPIIMVATDPLPEFITRAFKEGVTDFIPKPLVPEVVVAKLQKELERLRATEEAQRPAPGEEAVNPDAVTMPPPPDEAETSQGIEIEVEADNPASVDQGTPLPVPSSVTTSSGLGGSKGSILSGSLEGRTALSLIRVLVGKRRSGHLSLRDGEKKGELYFEKGHVFSAALEEISGEEAFLELASWKNCLYRFNPEKTPKTRAIKTSTAKLLRIASLSEE